MKKSSILLKIISVTIVIIGFWLNYYKYNVIENCSLAKNPYKIFPWSNHGIVSNSKLLWLSIHLTSSLTHIFLSCIVILTDANKNVMILFKYWHWFFTIIISSNIWNFGQTKLLISFLLNIVPLSIANLAYLNKQKWSYWKPIYFFSITSPIILEFILFMLKKLLKY